MTRLRTALLLVSSLSLFACSSSSNGSAKGGSGGESSTTDGGSAKDGSTAGGGADSGGSSGSHLQHIIVIAFENHDEAHIIGNTTDAPYINGLLPKYATASNFQDTLDILVPSEPHYVWMEAGTNKFSDVTFLGDAEPSATNSTSSTEHLSTQLEAASHTWMSYQEGLDAATSGACPIHSAGFYMPKHDPFVFFQDVSGNPPDAANSRCAAHHAPIETFYDAVTGKAPMPDYAFVTPNQCNDMHGQGGCPDSNLVKSGDDWLSQKLPDVITYAEQNHAAVFLVWDEGEASPTIPFIAIGPDVKPGYVSDVKVTHGSLIRTVENVFGIPALTTVASENDFADFFVGGALP